MAVYCTDYEKEGYEDPSHWRSIPSLIPSQVFQTRIKVGHKYEWKEVNTWELFAGKKVLMFSLPGAFTPTCSTYQLPTFEQMADEFYAEGIDSILCFTVNDAFVCNAWARDNKLNHIKVIPDGTGKFTEAMGMLVEKDNLGFGNRSWRYACIVDNGQIQDWFIEEGREDNCPNDPYLYTNPEYIMSQIRK